MFAFDRLFQWFNDVNVLLLFFFFALLCSNNKNGNAKTFHTIELSEKNQSANLAVQSEKDDYDPFNNRVVEHPTT